MVHTGGRGQFRNSSTGKKAACADRLFQRGGEHVIASFGTSGYRPIALYAKQLERFGRVMENWHEWRKQRRAELMVLREAVAEDDYYRWNTAITESLKGGFPWLQRVAVGFCWPHRGGI